MWKRLNRGGGAAVDPARYLCATVITSVPVRLTLNAADAVYSLLAAGLPGPGAPRIDSGMGRRPAAGSHRAGPTGICGRRSIPAWRMFGLYGLSFPGEVPWRPG